MHQDACKCIMLQAGPRTGFSPQPTSRPSPKLRDDSQPASSLDPDADELRGWITTSLGNRLTEAGVPSPPWLLSFLAGLLDPARPAGAVSNVGRLFSTHSPSVGTDSSGRLATEAR